MGHRMDNMAFWGVLVRFLLCCPLLLLTSAAVIQTSNPKNCSSGKGLTFTHVYSMPDSEEAAGQLQKVEGDDQNLVFRHHIRLQTPAADCEKSGLLNELLSRLKSLELEMKVMQEKYMSCCGAEGAAGGTAVCLL
ncbi:hypothetical protein FKM82_002203 [Ascaphus truei]